MTDREFAADQWDPPILSRHAPFPPPLGPLDLDVRWTLPAGLVALTWMSIYNGHGIFWLVFPVWPAWVLPASVALGAVYVANLVVIRGHHLLVWPVIIGRHVLLVGLAPLVWWLSSASDDDGPTARRAALAVRRWVQVGSNGTRHYAVGEAAVEYVPLRPSSHKTHRWRVPHDFARRFHRGGVTGRLTALLPRDVGRSLHATATVLPDGVLDTSDGLSVPTWAWLCVAVAAGCLELLLGPRVAVPWLAISTVGLFLLGLGLGPRWLRWRAGWLLGAQQLTALLLLSDTGNLDLPDADARHGIHSARNELFKRLRHSLSLYLRVRAFPVHDLLVAAGQVGVEAEQAEREGRHHPLLAWARTMVARRLLLAVPAATRGVLEQRLFGLLGLPDQPGKLAQAGLVADRLTPEEVRAVLAEAWGPDGRPALAINRSWVEVETGASDPPPLNDSQYVHPRGGNPGVRRHRTVVVSGLPDTVTVGYTEPVTGRRLEGDLAIHVQPLSDAYAKTILTAKNVLWRSLTLGRRNYEQIADQTDRTLDLMRQGETKVFRTGIYFTTATTQQPAAELALEEAFGDGHTYAPAFEQQQARASTEPTGRDRLERRFWTDSQTVAAAWPGTGGIWVPGAVLLGQSGRSKEPIGVNPWWGGGNSAIFICGGLGSGKTNLQQVFLARVLRPHPEHWLARRLPRPPRAVVTYYKPDDEWDAFCTFFGGRHHRLTNAGWRATLASVPLDTPIVAFNMISLADAEQVAFLKAVEERIDQQQNSVDERYREPLVYVIGEAWALAQDPVEARHLKKYALQARLLKLALIVDTQFLNDLLESEARNLPKACSTWVVMRTTTSERRILADQLEIGPKGMKFLAEIAQPNVREGGRPAMTGQGIIHAHGLTTTIQVKRFGQEARLLDRTSATRDETDPLYAVEREIVDARTRLEKLGLQLARG